MKKKGRGFTFGTRPCTDLNTKKKSCRMFSMGEDELYYLMNYQMVYMTLRHSNFNKIVT